MMDKRQALGCSCCGANFGALFSKNQRIAKLVRGDTSSISGRSGGGGAFSDIDRRGFLRGGIASVGAVGLLTDGARADESSATVFKGGKILTVDADFAEASAIAIGGNKIIAVGSEAEVLEAVGPDATLIELNGRVILPGFIDAHTHVIAGSVVDAVMDYVGMARFAETAEVLDYLTAKAKETPDGEWIVARNFDPAVQAGPGALGFSELDEVSAAHPVFVLNASGHLAYANRKAFEAAGIPENIENPPGAEFVRDENGRLTGEMKNNVAFLQVLESYPAMASVDPVEALIGLVGKWGALGLTTVSELSLGALSQSPADAGVMWAAAKSGRLKARIRAYPFYTFGAESWDEAGVKPGDGDAIVRIAGYKLVADGSNQGFTGLQREPYLNSENRGIAYMSPDGLTATAIDRASKGWHLAIHGNGDAAIDNVLDACDAMRAAGLDLSKVRVRIEHCSILHDEQIARMKDLGVSASFLIGHVHYWGVAMRDVVFGEEKAQLLDRCRSVEKAGVGFSLHSDFMVTDPNPLHMIEMAVTRRTWKEPDYVLAPDERVSVQSAIRAVTSEAAWQLYSDHEVGSLEPGKLADMVILEKDPRSVEPGAIKDIVVSETWMDGELVYEEQ
jgi:predicted amidohydrolase YtcJ